MTALHEDPRVIAGMRAQLAQRERMVHEGARPVGWKLGLGTPAAIEVAVHVARDVAAGASPEEIRAAIGGLGPAIELVDIDVPMDDAEAILAADIFHRGVILGPAQPHRGPVRGEVHHGDQVETAEDAFTATGDPVRNVAHVAQHLAAFGERLRAGDVIIMGSIVPLLSVAPGERIEYRNDPLGELRVSFVE
jgi:2-keto-4-pentenoate hydratase